MTQYRKSTTKLLTSELCHICGSVLILLLVLWLVYRVLGSNYTHISFGDSKLNVSEPMNNPPTGHHDHFDPGPIEE